MCEIEHYSKVLDANDALTSQRAVIVVCDTFPACPTGQKILTIIAEGDRLDINLSRPSAQT